MAEFHPLSWYQVFERQHGAAGLDQLLQSGLSSRKVAGLVLAGELTRHGRWLLVSSRWSARGDPREQWQHEICRTLFSCSPRLRQVTFAFRRTAAALWGLDGVPPDAVELISVSGRPGPAAIKRARPLAPEDRMSAHGFPITSPARALLDLGQVADEDVIERALESALRKGYASVDGLSKALGTARQRPGTRALRVILGRRPPGAAPTESDAETLFLQLARRAGLPEPRRQHVVPTAEGTFRVDFAWPDQRLAVEVDGAAAHASREALARDLRRQNRLLLSLAPAQWSLLRFTWDDLTQPPYLELAAAKLREAWRLSLMPAFNWLAAPASPG